MNKEECFELMKSDLMEGQLSVAQIADKYFDWATPTLRDSVLAMLEELKRLYNLKKILND